MLAKAKEDSVEVPRDVIEERVRGRIREMKEEYGSAALVRQLQDEGLTAVYYTHLKLTTRDQE